MGHIFYPRCSHICPRALCEVCTCARDTEWDPLPLRHLPRLSLQSPQPPPRSLDTSLLEKPGGAEQVTLSMGRGAGTRPGIDTLQPRQKEIASPALLGLSFGAAHWHSGSWRRVAKGEAQLDL